MDICSAYCVQKSKDNSLSFGSKIYDNGVGLFCTDIQI